MSAESGTSRERPWESPDATQLGREENGHAVPPSSLSTAELALLTEVLAGLEQDADLPLIKLADAIRLGMGGSTVTVTIHDVSATSGESPCRTALEEPIHCDGHAVGRIAVETRSQPYSGDEIGKLRHYADLVGTLWRMGECHRRVRREALTDEVTGLYNRRYVMRFLPQLLARAEREQFRVTVLLFDIDDFKSYNDVYGHDAGDEIIRRIGHLFRSHCREHDVVTRYGGDEFCVVFWDADKPRRQGSDHPSDAFTVLDRFRRALQACHHETLGEEARGSLTISGGLASYPADSSTACGLIAKADQALLSAKQAGKNRVFVFGDTEECVSRGTQDPGD